MLLFYAYWIFINENKASIEIIQIVQTTNITIHGGAQKREEKKDKEYNEMANVILITYVPLWPN